MTSCSSTSETRDSLLSVRDLCVEFPLPKARTWPWQPVPRLKAVNKVSFDLDAGHTLGLVGESGCGKSTLARALVGLVPVRSGDICWQGTALQDLGKKAFHELRREVQMIFQDPLASLNPRMTIGHIIAEPLRNYEPHLSAHDRKLRVRAVMDRVGLLPNMINRYPHEFSGGQCQRVGIARALILKPRLLVCDEPVSALDVSIQAQIINLLRELQREMGLSLLFIAHDLAVVRYISDTVMVMYLGNTVEMADAESLYSHPAHPYTQALMSAVPVPDPKAAKAAEICMLEGDLPSPVNPPSGCVFRTRCPRAVGACAEARPQLRGTERQQAACILVEEL
ncbi:MAG: ATP-binding cassette domain-containing protein [Kistimonas sp.]|nr:ATP-binding cassette domain-containing protein [Kistimonas sp.]